MMPLDLEEMRVNSIARVVGVFVWFFVCGTAVFGPIVAAQLAVVLAGIVWSLNV